MMQPVPMRHARDAVTVTFTGEQFETIVIVLVLATTALVCVALYATWPKWSWEKRRGR